MVRRGRGVSGVCNDKFCNGSDYIDVFPSAALFAAKEETAMKIIKMCVVTGLTLAIPVVALARANVATASISDARYCAALAQKYAVAHPIMQAPNAATAVAASECQSDPKDSIATLKKAMNDEKIGLPTQPQG